MYVETSSTNGTNCRGSVHDMLPGLGQDRKNSYYKSFSHWHLRRQLTIILGPCQNIRAMRPGPKHWVASYFVTVMSKSLSTARECKITENHVKAWGCSQALSVSLEIIKIIHEI